MKQGIIYALITAVLFVTLEPVSKLIADTVNPYAITFWRFLIGSLILLPFAWAKIKKNHIKITPKDIGIMTLLGVLVICFSMVALQIGVKIADAPALIAILFSSNSVFTIVFAVFMLKEKLNRRKILALAFGIAGVLVCADFSAGSNIASIALAVFAALSFSFYTICSRKYANKIGGIVQTCIVFFAGSIVLLAALLIGGVDLSLNFDVKTISIMLYLGIFITGAGYAAYFKGIEKGGPIMASFAFFIKPILTPFVTFFVTGISSDWTVYLALVCIVIASYFAVYAKDKTVKPNVKELYTKTNKQ